MQFYIEISPAHPALPGHFPGAPVVPAVVLADQIAGALERAVGKPVYSIRQLRLLGLIEPGHRVEVDYQEKTPDSWRLTCKVAGQLVAKGIFSGQPPEINGLENVAAPQSADSQMAASVYEQLPHADSMQLIDEFDLTANGARTRAGIGENHPLADESGLPAWATLEYAAQLMACRKISMGGEPMNRAVIVLVRSLVRNTANAVPVGSELSVEVSEEVAQPGAVQCAFTAARGGELIASGEFTVVSES
jgi:predicted hotdog family 3-hydroxylacyl-ACP dehydratase